MGLPHPPTVREGILKVIKADIILPTRLINLLIFMNILEAFTLKKFKQKKSRKQKGHLLSAPPPKKNANSQVMVSP